MTSIHAKKKRKWKEDEEPFVLMASQRRWEKSFFKMPFDSPITSDQCDLKLSFVSSKRKKEKKTMKIIVTFLVLYKKVTNAINYNQCWFFLRRFLMPFNRFQQEYRCSFCDESLRTSDDTRTHLRICASKTDECPICNRYILRSIFAYHIDNN